MNIGLIGAGSIGAFLLEKVNIEETIPNVKITSLFDERKQSAQKMKMLKQTYGVELYQNLESFLNASVDLVIECANIPVVNQYAKKILHKRDLLLISVGALADEILYNELREIAENHHTKLYLPSGAIGGLDVLRAANVLGGLETVKITTIKPAHALTDQHIDHPKTIFSGSAEAAIKRFPKNTNITIIISLAGIGTKKTKVEVIADPNIQKNAHHLEARGDFGKLSLKLENNPSPTNPKTSYLTALSILSSLKSLDHSIKIG